MLNARLAMGGKTSWRAEKVECPPPQLNYVLVTATAQETATERGEDAAHNR